MEEAVLVLSTGNGSAYVAASVQDWLAARGVLHLRSVPATPTHNGRAERAIGLLEEAAGIVRGAPVIRSSDAAVEALARGVERVHARRRPVLGGLTSPEAHASADRWYRRAHRGEVLDDARAALIEALRDTTGPHARRRAERRAILSTLVKHNLMTITGGTDDQRPVEPEGVL